MKQHRMVDLQSQYKRLQSEIDDAMANVLEETTFINGPAVKSFQSNLETYLNVKHVIPCANGTDALQIALMALDLQPDDEVITSTFTFIATVEVIALLKLKPVLIDVDPDTFTLIPDEVEKAITSKTKAIMPVHLFGQGADMNAIMAIAQKHNLSVVEDTAQAIGCDYEFNSIKTKLGSIGNIGCTSFFPSKNLGCFGDGGACFTNNDVLAEKMRMIVNHGSKKKYYHQTIGVNSRLDTIQAAVLDVKLNYLNDFNQRRQNAASWYDQELKNIEEIQLPARASNSDHIFHQYTLKIKGGKRDDLQAYLKECNIPSMVYYPVPLHQQEAFIEFQEPGRTFSNAEHLSSQVLSLPMHTELSKEQLKDITDTIKRFFNHEQ